MILPQNFVDKSFGKPQITMHLPQDCLLCAANSADLICEDCANDLPRLPDTRCPVCAIPTPNGETCGRCLAKPPHFDVTHALYPYEFPLDKLVQSFKYGHRLALANYFGAQLASLAHGTGADRIIPLPLHGERLRTRGFNQALELARPVAKKLQRPLSASLCQRIRNTPAQADLPWKERRKNIRHAFQCTADVTGQTILLVDDVMTTGSSLDECARTLKLHGAKAVIALVVARALQK